MTDRATLLTDFVVQAGCDASSLTLIAGDASNRKYFRVQKGPQVRVVMDAPPDKGEDTAPFVRIAQWLRGIGLSAPEVLAQDTDAGFLLLEDLGDAVFARVLRCGKAEEAKLYDAASDVLRVIAEAHPPPLPRYDAATMAPLAALSVTWYAAGLAGHALPEAESTLGQSLYSALEPLDTVQPVLIQRDYHAENLLWLPKRDGAARVGLLDFQDAMLGHPAYDLVSVLQDARRDVAPEVQVALLDRTGHDPDAYHLLGLQRNLRILGVFARLSLRDGKPHYIDLIPRVWGHIETCLDRLGPCDLTRMIRGLLPAPTADRLTVLKARRP